MNLADMNLDYTIGDVCDCGMCGRENVLCKHDSVEYGFVCPDCESELKSDENYLYGEIDDE